MYRSTKIITTLGITATLFYGAVIFIHVGKEDIKETTQQTTESTTSVYNTDEKFGENSSLDMSGVTELLKENGVSEEKIAEMQKTASGATIMGDALPAKEYRTLNDAETAFGYYLGLHNKIDSLPEYELTAMHIINNEFMQGTYENSDGTKSILVKTSKTKSASEMSSVYTGNTYSKEEYIHGVEVKLQGKQAGTINVASFNVQNGKEYVISSVAGLDEANMLDVLAELIVNIQGMEDWID